MATEEREVWLRVYAAYMSAPREGRSPWETRLEALKMANAAVEDFHATFGAYRTTSGA